MSLNITFRTVQSARRMYIFYVLIKQFGPTLRNQVYTKSSLYNSLLAKIEHDTYSCEIGFPTRTDRRSVSGEDSLNHFCSGGAVPIRRRRGVD
ncbi:hypothetical protein PENTCL1PPCAC_20478 [Pristionchus entomophagus]|uniref:Uncharacterized protein n=1 Tax=Pristionchus entomophagus TaxID=358040 RepID=A0AAV5TVP6_9BILA|nr:hypothetical protein PENTCL1PPCAC_20478 [Pristionchus entomophagus]